MSDGIKTGTERGRREGSIRVQQVNNNSSDIRQKIVRRYLNFFTFQLAFLGYFGFHFVVGIIM